MCVSCQDLSVPRWAGLCFSAYSFAAQYTTSVAILAQSLSRTWLDMKSVRLWHIPPRSPDLNPVEKFWSWLRRKLRQMDLDDLVAKRPPATKTKLQSRVRALCETNKAKQVAGNCVKGLRKVCLETLKKKGAATRG